MNSWAKIKQVWGPIFKSTSTLWKKIAKAKSSWIFEILLSVFWCKNAQLVMNGHFWKVRGFVNLISYKRCIETFKYKFFTLNCAWNFWSLLVWRISTWKIRAETKSLCPILSRLTERRIFKNEDPRGTHERPNWPKKKQKCSRYNNHW